MSDKVIQCECCGGTGRNDKGLRCWTCNGNGLEPTQFYRWGNHHDVGKREKPEQDKEKVDK